MINLDGILGHVFGVQEHCLPFGHVLENDQLGHKITLDTKHGIQLAFETRNWTVPDP